MLPSEHKNIINNKNPNYNDLVQNGLNLQKQNYDFFPFIIQKFLAQEGKKIIFNINIRLLFTSK